MIYHVGPRVQRGKGLGSLLGALFRGFAPVAKLGLKVGKSIAASPLARKIGESAMDIAKTSAVKLAADMVEGRNLKESAQEELNTARQRIASTLRGGRKRKGVKNKKIVRKNCKKGKYCLLD